MRVSARKVGRFVSSEGRHRELLNLTQLLKNTPSTKYILWNIHFWKRADLSAPREDIGSSSIVTQLGCWKENIEKCGTWNTLGPVSRISIWAPKRFTNLAWVSVPPSNQANQAGCHPFSAGIKILPGAKCILCRICLLKIQSGSFLHISRLYWQFGYIFFLELFCGPLWKGFSPSPADKC